MITAAKETPFLRYHQAAGARLVEFAGYQMPIQYRSILTEHQKVRTEVGLFDLSHMGEFFVGGSGALDFLQKMNTNDVASLSEGKILYSALCYPDGGIVDDLLIYHLGDRYMLVVNAANIEKDFDWLMQHKPADVRLENCSDELGLLAIQGPQAAPVMSQLTDSNLDVLAYYESATAGFEGIDTLFSRTGYTGEDGFEIYCRPEIAESLWERIMRTGAKFDIEPIGLGARDSLRLEMRYLLYGNDIDQTTNPVEAGLAWICKLDKPDFIGKQAVAEMKQNKPQRKLQSLVLTERGIPRKGYQIFSGEERIGEVTSGCQSPSLGQGIALGYIKRGFGRIGSRVEIDIRGKRVGAEIIKGTFYKTGSHK